MLTIGLFGTCAGSKWREPFKERYQALNIDWFDPQVDDWKPEDAIKEAEHLANDAIILFPVTKESYGLGSLAETGFSILQAIRLDDRRDFVIFIEQAVADNIDDQLSSDGTKNPKSLAKESLRSRALVQEHLKKLRLPNVYVVDSLTEMLKVSVQLYAAATLREPLKKFNPHNR